VDVPWSAVVCGVVAAAGGKTGAVGAMEDEGEEGSEGGGVVERMLS
jgi:hypothetical protein